MASFLGLALLMNLCFGVWTLAQFKDMPASSIYFSYICISTFQLEPHVASFVILCWLTLMKTWSLAANTNPGLCVEQERISAFVAVSGTFAVVTISTNREGLAILLIQP
ncbi:hypothetical protein L218DRAFT_942122 [Marasmius fiardii PR-910]|nr:hypothetical protein L218DRAFT_942122 [Marasmius fiardii PR-910]